MPPTLGSVTPMHPDAIHVNAEMVARLLGSQLPELAHLPLRRLDSGGTVNVIFRLGEAHTVRLPMAAWGEGAIQREARCLGRLAPHLNLAIPEVVGVGVADDVYPFSWSVHRWIDGVMARPGTVDQGVAADRLAGFVHDL